MAVAGKWMELETLMLSEISQTHKVKGLIFFAHMQKLDQNIEKDKWNKIKMGEFNEIKIDKSGVEERYWGGGGRDRKGKIVKWIWTRFIMYI